jgi:hypothetical protein
MGTLNRIISKNEYKSIHTFKKYRLGVNADKYAIFSFSNFYDEKTFKRL